jgi:hypothetical protein
LFGPAKIIEFHGNLHFLTDYAAIVGAFLSRVMNKSALTLFQRWRIINQASQFLSWITGVKDCVKLGSSNVQALFDEWIALEGIFLNRFFFGRVRARKFS